MCVEEISISPTILLPLPLPSYLSFFLHSPLSSLTCTSSLSSSPCTPLSSLPSPLPPPLSQERMALSIADLISCASMLTANMLIREAYNGYTKGEKAMVEQLQDFFSTLGLIQRDAVWWIDTIVPTMFRPQPVDYKTCLRKVLFLEPTESYTSKDNWPPESDRRWVWPVNYYKICH